MFSILRKKFGIKTNEANASSDLSSPQSPDLAKKFDVSTSEGELNDALKDVVLRCSIDTPIKKKPEKKTSCLCTFFRCCSSKNSTDVDQEQVRAAITDAHSENAEEQENLPPHRLSPLKSMKKFRIKRNDAIEMPVIFNYGRIYELFDAEEGEDRFLIIAERSPIQGTLCHDACTYSSYFGVFNFIGVEIFKLEGEFAGGLCGGGQLSLQIQDGRIRFGEIVDNTRGSEKYLEIHDAHGHIYLEAGESEDPNLRRCGVIDVTTVDRQVIFARISPVWDSEKDEKIDGQFYIEFTKGLPVEIRAILIAIAIVKDTNFFGKLGA